MPAPKTVQLRTRHWIITDASGRKQEIRGEGVVGEQPVLEPGERFEYTSGVPLPTASGFMTGRYQMVTASGEQFEIDVPTFSLDSPDSQAGVELSAATQHVLPRKRVSLRDFRTRLPEWVMRRDVHCGTSTLPPA